MTEHKIGYIYILSEKGENFIGGILVVDESGLPIEFRYSEPITPNKVQIVLYGKSITKFIKVETIGKNIIKEIENKPEIFIVPDDEYFALNKYYKIPLVCVSYFPRDPLPQFGDIIEMNESEILIQTSSVREPIKVRVESQMAPSMTSVKSVILSIGKSMDVIEPLKRVENALRIILNEGI